MSDCVKRLQLISSVYYCIGNPILPVLNDSPKAGGIFLPLSTSVSCEEKKSGNDANLRNRNGKSNYILGKNVFVHLHSAVR